MIYNIKYSKIIGGSKKLEDYKVPEKIHKNLINFFEKVINIFEEYDIKYSIMFGTLLGAIRHKNIIPWDDDIDIDMLEDQVEILTSENVIKKLNENNISLSYMPYKNHKNRIIKLYDSNGKEFSNFEHKYPFIDIYTPKLENNKYIKEKDNYIIYKDKDKNYYHKEQYDELVNYEFDRLMVKGIKDPEDLLTRLYPDWEKKAYIGCWDHSNEKRKYECGFYINL